jgi:hypothetical protein
MPNGNPKRKQPLDLDSLCRSYTLETVKQVSGILINDPDSGRRLEAAKILLDRGYGRPRQDNTHELKGEVRVILRKMLEDEDGNSNGDAA